MKATCALAMIVRDEEQNLPGCLESVKGLFDEIAIVDTGSVDATVKVAKKYGARVYPFRWIDDFSAARNYGLDRVRADFVFRMDADDRLMPGHAKRLARLLAGLDPRDPVAYFCRVFSSEPGVTSFIDEHRLWPNRPALRFRGAVHERIRPEYDARDVPTRMSDVAIVHHGYADPNQVAAKLARNVAILEREVARGPVEPIVLFDLGRTYAGMDRLDAALDALNAFVKHRDPAHNLASQIAHRRIVEIHRVKEDYDAAIAAAHAGLKAHPRDAQLDELGRLPYGARRRARAWPGRAIPGHWPCTTRPGPTRACRSTSSSESRRRSHASRCPNPNPFPRREPQSHRRPGRGTDPMSDALQAEVDRLKALNEKLARDLVGAHDDLKEVRGEARDRRHENKALAAQVADLTTQRDSFRAAAEADPEDLRRTISELSGKIRETTHRAAFEQAARSLKVSDPARVADLWALAGYKPESDEADPKRLAATIGAALKGRPWLVDAEPTPTPAASAATPAPGGAGATTPTTPAVPGPGSDRGQSVPATPAQAPGGKPPGALSRALSKIREYEQQPRSVQFRGLERAARPQPGPGQRGEAPRQYQLGRGFTHEQDGMGPDARLHHHELLHEGDRPLVHRPGPDQGGLHRLRWRVFRLPGR